ncbi:MAG: alpha/beta hydrolase family protein [Armatimonadota bacterium]
MSIVQPPIPGEPILYGPDELHGMFFAPAAPRAAVLLAPPLFEEGRSAHRAVITGARALARAGAAVLHAEVSATGNNPGSLTQATIGKWLDDLRHAAAYLVSRADAPLSVVGCRLGALLAARAIAEGLAAGRFVLWQPVTDGRAFLSQIRTRRAIQDKMTGETPPETGPYEVEGQELSPELYAGLEALSMPDALPVPALRLLQCSFNDRLLGEYGRLQARWGMERLRARCVVAGSFWLPHSPGEYAELSAALVEEVLG